MADEASTDDAVDNVEEDVVVTRSSPTYLRSRRRCPLTTLRPPIVDTEEDEGELITLVVLALALLLLLLLLALAADGSRFRATRSGRAVAVDTAAARSCAMRRI